MNLNNSALEMKTTPKVAKKKAARAKPTISPCPHCGKLLANESLQKHIERVHEKIRNMICDLCGYTGYGKASLRAHLMTHLPKNIKCPECKFITSHKRKLRLHMNWVHARKKTKVDEDEKIPCDECHMAFKSPLVLEAHRQRIHEKLRNFECNECDMKFFSKIDLR